MSPGAVRARLTLAALLLGSTGALVGLGLGVEAPVAWSDLRTGFRTGRTTPEALALATARLGALAVAGWLLAATLLALGARAAARGAARPTRWGRTVACLAAVVLPGPLRGLAEPARATPPAVVAPAATRAALVPLGLPDPVAPLGPVRSGRVPAAPAPAPRLDPVPLPAPGPDAVPVPLPAPHPDSPPAPAPAPLPASAPGPAPGHHRVAPGEHLWGIATAVVRARTGADDVVGIDRYWRALCAANRDRVVSGDVNVVRPGEDLVLPPGP